MPIGEAFSAAVAILDVVYSKVAAVKTARNRS
jgi:hypothetical protein